MLTLAAPRRVAIVGGSRIPFARSHGAYAGQGNQELLTAALHSVVERFRLQGHRLGDVIGSNAMFVLPGGNKRSPDVSFVAAGRLDTETNRPFPELAPDLAVEVVSPSDRPRQILDKVGEYLQAGVRLVWVIEPKKRQATAYRGLTDVRVIDAAGSLDGEDVLPGFTCRLADILD